MNFTTLQYSVSQIVYTIDMSGHNFGDLKNTIMGVGYVEDEMN